MHCNKQAQQPPPPQAQLQRPQPDAANMFNLLAHLMNLANPASQTSSPQNPSATLEQYLAGEPLGPSALLAAKPAGQPRADCLAGQQLQQQQQLYQLLAAAMGQQPAGDAPDAGRAKLAAPGQSLGAAPATSAGHLAAASSLASLISLSAAGNQLQLAHQHQLHANHHLNSPYERHATSNDTNSSALLARLAKNLTSPYQLSNTNHQQQQQPNSIALAAAGNTFAASFPDQQPARRHIFDQVSLRFLESLYAMNDEPEDEAIELIAQRINSTSHEVADWFHLRREAEASLYNSLSSSLADNSANVSPNDLNGVSLASAKSPAVSKNNNNNNNNHNNNTNNNNTNNNHMPPGSANSNTSSLTSNTNGNTFKAQPPTVPSSSLLAKLNAVTTRPNSHILSSDLDDKTKELLEAFYTINDNPEPAAIEMIARRINLSAEAIGDWFDEKRIKVNPNAGPRSPPAKKREGGRVVTFSEYQRSLLEAIFDENNYLHPQEYEELSNLIQVPSRNIKIWFKNRRSKQRLSGRIATPCSATNNNAIDAQANK